MLVIFLPRILFLAGVSGRLRPDRGINLSDASRTSLQPRFEYYKKNLVLYMYIILE